jgi:hypothetical protein
MVQCGAIAKGLDDKIMYRSGPKAQDGVDPIDFARILPIVIASAAQRSRKPLDPETCHENH